jgi:c-di-GMP-binding flagellar brake protein YcgR
MTVASLTVPSAACDIFLEQSIRARVRAILTHRAERGWRTYKAKLISGSKTRQTLVMELPREQGCVYPLPPASAPVGVTFRHGRTKCMFSTVIETVRLQLEGSILTLRWPKEVQRFQRRVYQRARPPRGSVVPIRFWRDTPSGSEGPADREVRHGQLEDLSAGGMRIKVANADPLEIGDTCRCSFAPSPSAPTIVVEATLLHRDASEDGRATLGFQFIGLETTAEGRKTLAALARIVNRLHRSRRDSRSKVSAS